MEIEITVADLIKEAKECLQKSDNKRFIKIIPENGFNSSMNRHPIENYLHREGLGNYYFEGDSVEREGDYAIDFNRMKVNYL